MPILSNICFLFNLPSQQNTPSLAKWTIMAVRAGSSCRFQKWGITFFSSCFLRSASTLLCNQAKVSLFIKKLLRKLLINLEEVQNLYRKMGLCTSTLFAVSCSDNLSCHVFFMFSISSWFFRSSSSIAFFISSTSDFE